jgi:hypothetical protein
MFIVDDVISEAVSYLFTRVEATRESHDEAISSVKIAMRGLSASFGEIIEFYRKCGHKLQRLLVAQDEDGFWRFLSEMLDEERLRNFCNESGVCQELRIAQDKLFSIPVGGDSKAQRLITDLAIATETYERGFIEAIKEYFEKAERIDLVAAASRRDTDPPEAITVLNKCIEGLEEQKRKIDSVLHLIQDRAMRSWL